MQQNAKFIRKLPIPMDIKKEFPVTEEVAKVREARVEEMRAILDGRDSRLMLIIGPCSADREDSVMDYVCRLVPLQEKVKDKILIVPRIYTNKPRTNGSGYKGMLHQPDNVAHRGHHRHPPSPHPRGAGDWLCLCRRDALSRKLPLSV